MILLIDNYDSFTYNLYQMAGALNPDIRVVKNDEMTLEEIAALAPSHIILSPGPGRPAEAGICEAAVRRFQGETPILGVCLGHQAICEALGGEIVYAARLMHGKKSSVRLNPRSPIFRGLPPVLDVARYHSLAARRDSLPGELTVIAEDEWGEVMAVEARGRALYGLQFHPESVLTLEGEAMMRNFLAIPTKAANRKPRSGRPGPGRKDRGRRVS